MSAGFKYEEVLDMDVLSFGACLRRVMKRRHEEIMIDTTNQRVAYHADGKGWKEWNKNMEKAIGKKKQGPEAFHAAFATGAFNQRPPSRRDH